MTEDRLNKALESLSGEMKWESRGMDYRLIAADGEVLERVRYVHSMNEWVVESTGRGYSGSEAAKTAAEKNQGKRPS